MSISSLIKDWSSVGKQLVSNKITGNSYGNGAPVVYPSTHTVAVNGTITLNTALDVIYSSGLWVVLPAASISGAAGLAIYWCVMSSTTVGVVYSNGNTLVSSLTADNEFIGIRPSSALVAVTGTNTSQSLPTNTPTRVYLQNIKSGLLGTTGSARFSVLVQNNNSGGTKRCRIYIGAVQLDIIQNTSGTVSVRTPLFKNQGVANVNVFFSDIATASSFTRSTVNTAISQPIYATLEITANTDWCMLTCFRSVVYNT